MRIKVKMISLVIIAMIFSLVPQGVAKAVSDYDTLVQAAPYWKVSDNLGNSYDTNIQEAINNITSTSQKEQCQAVYEKFTQMEYRAYTLMRESRYNEATYAYAYGSNDSPGTTSWSIQGPTKRAHALWNDVVIIPLKYDSVNNKVIAEGCGDNTGLTHDVGYANRWNDGFTSLSPYLTEGFQADYPSGYEGDSIPSADRTGLIQGNVTCANTNNVISDVLINVQSGLDGEASIIDDGNGLGGKDYRYYLTEESPYSIIVMCDGDPFYGPTVSTDFYYNYNWVCTVTGGQNYCAAS